MKVLLAVFVVAMALGIAMGLSGWQSASIMAKMDVAIVVFFGGLLLFSVWIWSRATPGSGDRQIMPTLMLLSGAQLLLSLPRLLWPDGGWARTVWSIMVVCAMIGLLLRQRRQRHQRRAS